MMPPRSAQVLQTIGRSYQLCRQSSRCTIAKLSDLRALSSSATRHLEQETDSSFNGDGQAGTSRYATEGVDDHQVPLMKRIRIVPDSPSYFSARPKFTDAFLRVEEHYLRYKILPRVENPPQIYWHDFDSLKAQSGNEPISQTRYRTLVKMLKELSAIEPVLMPPEVTELLLSFKRAYQPSLIKPQEFAVDEWGRSLGVGKRKTCTAKAYLVMGEGEVLINGQNITKYFGRMHDRESALWPLKITNRMDQYNVFAVVNGGGITGQAEALTLAVARALLVHEPTLSQRLLEAGCLYRDARVVERKKPGHLKARKMPTWVKR